MLGWCIVCSVRPDRRARFASARIYRNPVMTEPRLILAGLGPKLSGLTWETNKSLRIGRQTNLDVVLRDHSVDRIHAEVRHQCLRWVVRDLAHNPLFPTLL